MLTSPAHASLSLDTPIPPTLPLDCQSLPAVPGRSRSCCWCQLEDPLATTCAWSQVLCVPLSAWLCRNPFIGQTPIGSDFHSAPQPNPPPTLYISKHTQKQRPTVPSLCCGQ